MKLNHLNLVTVAILLVLGGCGSRPERSVNYPPVEQRGGAQLTSMKHATAAPSSAADGEATSSLERDAPTARKKFRPGLGTHWGENRHSPVKHAPFQRAGSNPFTSLAVYYNDAEGIAAQSRSRGGKELSDYRASAGGIAVTLHDHGGRPYPGQQAGGRTYVVGRAGKRYTIVLRNNTPGRYEVVASVDGLDVIDGNSASIAKRGYLLPPHGSLTIDGFRRSDQTVAAFRFGDVRGSYAARTSGDRNVGVIGIAFFGERGSRWTADEIRRRESAQPFPLDTGYAKPPSPGLVF